MTSSPYSPEYYLNPVHAPRAAAAVKHVFGLDLGQVHDPSAIAVLDHSRTCIGRSPVTYDWIFDERFSFRHLERLPLGLDYPSIVEHVRRLVSRPELNPSTTTLVVDATGVGRPVVDLLRRAHLPCRLMPVTITAGNRQTCEENVWGVPKRDLITGLLLFQQQEIDICGHLPESETLVRELGNIRIKVSLAGHDTYGAWREGEHDDLVLAAALACWQTFKKAPPPMWGTNPIV